MASRGSNLDFSGLLTSRGNQTRPVASQTVDDKRIVRFKPGGYPDDMFLEMTESEKNKYGCNICFLVAKDPRQCTNSHLFCATCIFTWTLSPSGDNKDRCPVCRSPGRYRPDLKSESRLNRKRVACSEDKCTWKGTLLSFKKHYKNVHLSSDNTTPCDPVLPPIIAPSINQGYAELDRSDDSQDMLWRLVQEPTAPPDRQTTRPLDRRRLEDLFHAFSTRLEYRRQNIESHYRLREAQRQDQWNEVENLGRRLDEVSGDLNRLMSDMHRDSSRYHHYIQTSRDMEDSLVNLTHSFPNSISNPPQTDPDAQLRSSDDPCVNAEAEPFGASQGTHLHSIDDINRNTTFLTPPPDHPISSTTRPQYLSVLPRQTTSTTSRLQVSPRRPPLDVTSAINTNLARSRASSRRITESPRHSLGSSPHSLPLVNSRLPPSRRLPDAVRRPAVSQSLNVSGSLEFPSANHRQSLGSGNREPRQNTSNT